MNKELIKTYKNEFEHWLNGGNVQAFYKKDDEPKWITDEECIEYEGHDNFSHILQNSLEPEDVLIIIEDEYIEFRGALADGKTIQLDEAAKFSDPNRGWVDLSCKSFGSSTHLFPVSYYRIKPEEPKLKVGDWVRWNDMSRTKVFEIDDYDGEKYHFKNEIHWVSSRNIELWDPKPGEYFWYKNDLVKFQKSQTNAGTLLESARGCSYYPAEENFEDYCEPFIGQLPTTIKFS